MLHMNAPTCVSAMTRSSFIPKALFGDGLNKPDRGDWQPGHANGSRSTDVKSMTCIVVADTRPRAGRNL